VSGAGNTLKIHRNRNRLFAAAAGRR